MRITSLLLAAVVLAPMSAAAENCTPISSLPATIGTPGKYCLVANHTVNLNAGNAITIASNDVTLDCDGHAIKNTSTANNGSSAGIHANSRNGITVKNCRVMGGFTNGIDLFQINSGANTSYYSTIQDNYIAGPFLHGIRAYGSALEITGNRVYDIGGQAGTYAIGIRVGGSANGFRLHVVRGNYVAGTNSPFSAAYGIFSDNSLVSAFLDNGIVGTSPAAGKPAYGMYIKGQHNRLADNHIVGVGAPNEVGIHADDATSSCFDNYLRVTLNTRNCDAGLGNY
ncbi:hypothetical protein [Lysobacter sp. A3-1-A15]|uniref:hypothetical protein n=1 Tax=Novilysobacter viscosus TaxID=3098602 RepID=UPI002EDB7C73